MSVPLLQPVRRWYCPACGKRAETRDARPHVPGHTCPRLRGLSVPFVPDGTAAKIELREREDYIGAETVQLDPERRRPVMSIVTTRDNGQDVAVFAPTATARGDA